MRKKLALVLGAAFLAFAGTACEGPQGPAGPQGAQGPAGPEGPQGPPGQNAGVTCTDCHNSDATLGVIEQQFALSPHGFGNFEVRDPAYAGGVCARCHTSEGFIAQVTGTEPDWGFGASSMTCKTCHQIHTDFEEGDFAVVSTAPVQLMITGETVDLGGTGSPGSNLCASCHQGRTSGAWPSWEAPMTQMFAITSTHYGVHHGPQTNIYTTQLDPLFEFGVTTASSFSPHVNVSCVGCHMGFGVDGFVLAPTAPDGELSHTYEPAVEVCATCHDADFNYGDVQEDVAAALAELGACLAAEGVIELAGEGAPLLADHGAFERPDYHPVTGMHPEPYVAAFLAYDALVQDGSFGVHQPRYAPRLADAALDFMRDNSDLCPVVE